MLNIETIILSSEKYLKEKGIKRARREAEEVIADVLGMKRLDLYLQFDRPIVDHELPVLRRAIQRRSTREPTAYISGYIDFAGIKLSVTPDVLIPRSETEILVEKICQKLSTIPHEKKVLWDVCCGSGCIGLALKNRFPALEVVLSDLSAQAITVAQKNACATVTFKQGDLFAPFASLKCDFFVCNPPYVTEAEYTTLEPEVLREPKMALVAGLSGLEFYARIAKELRNYLNAGGLAWLELGAGQGSNVKDIFESEGWHCHYEPDWSGQDRFFFIENF